jgi:hypothetical protein
MSSYLNSLVWFGISSAYISFAHKQFGLVWSNPVSFATFLWLDLGQPYLICHCLFVSVPTVQVLAGFDLKARSSLITELLGFVHFLFLLWFGNLPLVAGLAGFV